MTGRSAGSDPQHPEHPDPSSDAWSAWLPQLDAPTTPPPPASVPPTPAVPLAPPPSAPMSRYAASPVPAPAPPVRQLVTSPPPNRLVPAILCTVLCFLPFGIVAVVKANSVNRLWAQGRQAEAARASRSAKNWCLLAALVWPGSSVLFAAAGLLWGLSLLR